MKKLNSKKKLKLFLFKAKRIFNELRNENIKLKEELEKKEKEKKKNHGVIINAFFKEFVMPGILSVDEFNRLVPKEYHIKK